MHKAVKAILLGGSIAALGACVAGPADRSALAGAPIAPAEYSIPAAPVSTDVAQYWLMLDDPLLSEFVAQALRENLEIEQSLARLDQARAGLRGARAGFLPNVGGNAGVSRDVGDFASDDFNLTLSADVNWQVDLFGRIRGDVAASRADLAAAGYTLADIQRLIVGTVATSTIQARNAAVQLAIARDTLVNQDENLQIAIWRRQAGLVSSLDVEQARVQRAQTAASIPQLESDLASIANAISTLIGEAPGTVRERFEARLMGAEGIPVPPASIGLGAPAELLRRRPDIRSAELRLVADGARIDVARAQLLPLLAISGNIGTGATSFGDLFDLVTGNLFAGVSQLIFDGGRTRAGIDGAEAQARFSLAAWRLSVLRALEEVETSSIDLDAAAQRVILFGAAREAADNAAILARSQYQAGLIDFQTLLTAENQLLSARNSYAGAEAARAISFVRLTQALGGGWDVSRTEFLIDPPEIILTSDEGRNQ